MNLRHMFCQFLVRGFVCLVQKKENEVEAGEEGCWQVDILLRVPVGIVAAVEWIGCSED